MLTLAALLLAADRAALTLWRWTRRLAAWWRPPPADPVRWRLGGGWQVELAAVVRPEGCPAVAVFALVCPSRRRCWLIVPRARNARPRVPCDN